MVTQRYRKVTENKPAPPCAALGSGDSAFPGCCPRSREAPLPAELPQVALAAPREHKTRCLRQNPPLPPGQHVSRGLKIILNCRAYHSSLGLRLSSLTAKPLCHLLLISKLPTTRTNRIILKSTGHFSNYIYTYCFSHAFVQCS